MPAPVGPIVARLAGALGGEAAAAGEAAVGRQVTQAVTQQIGTQVGQEIANTPNALRSKIGNLERITASPSGLGSFTIDSWFPSFTHTILVAVSGGPDADLGKIWRLAVSTVFGIFRRDKIATWGSASLECVWDITDKSVAIRLGYGSNGLVPWALGQAGISGDTPLSIIQRGPSAEITGGSWHDAFRSIPQMFGSGGGTPRAMGGRLIPRKTETLDPNADTERTIAFKPAEATPKPEPLEAEGQVITTAWKIDPRYQPPKPPIKNIISLFSAALSAPCYLPPTPPPTRQLPPNSPPPPAIVPPGTSELRSVAGGLEYETQLDGQRLIQQQTSELRSTPNSFLDRDGYETDDDEDEEE